MNMGFKTDIEIAQETVMQPITEVAKTAGVDEKYLEQYGKYKVKVDYQILKDKANEPNGKLVLVTAINPHPRWRRQDHYHCWPGRRHAQAGQERNGRSA